MPRTNLGELEEQVLLALVRLGGESYAAQVSAQLAEITGRAVSPATVFMVMRRLESRRLLLSRVDADNPSWGGRPRRFYRVKTREVMPLLRNSRRARLALWKGIEQDLK